MSRVSFERYAKLASTGHSDTVVAGRYINQRLAEQKIPADVKNKLKLISSDNLLEIGCGPGSLLIPLSLAVQSATGIDNTEMLARVKKNAVDKEIVLVAGNFLDVEIDQKFSKILIYSVLQMLSDKDELFLFLDKATSLLNPGGHLLIGDLPNKDLKEKFLASKEGKTFYLAWNTELEKYDRVDTKLNLDSETIEINDGIIAEVISRYQNKGYNCLLLSQPHDLPFGHTRQDILVEYRK